MTTRGWKRIDCGPFEKIWLTPGSGKKELEMAILTWFGGISPLLVLVGCAEAFPISKRRHFEAVPSKSADWLALPMGDFTTGMEVVGSIQVVFVSFSGTVHPLFLDFGLLFLSGNPVVPLRNGMHPGARMPLY